MSFPDLDLVLRSLCGNILDRSAIRTLAVVKHVASTFELPIDVACSLVAPMNTLGIGDSEAPADLFNRTFNGRFAEIDGTVILAPAFVPPAYRQYRRLTCAGDVLAPRNKEYRQRVARALGLSETGLGEIVQRFRQKYRALRGTAPSTRTSSACRSCRCCTASAGWPAPLSSPRPTSSECSTR
ncbi:MAG TPA: hypothetical protein VII16_17240 [Actinomycetes bacterium]|jgi:hypothetical protein